MRELSQQVSALMGIRFFRIRTNIENAARSPGFVVPLVLALWLHAAFVSQADENGRADESWRSELYPEDWTPEFRTDDGRFLHDFSYSGYHRGERAIPDEPPGATFDVTAPPYEADPTGERDSTAVIQQAIDDAADAGGGIVYLPAGEYRVTPRQSGGGRQALHVRHDSIVLRGDGPDETFLFNDDPVMRGAAIVRFARRDNWWYGALPDSERQLSGDMPVQSTAVPLDDIDGLSPGDWIVLRNDMTEAFVREVAGDWLVEHWAGRLHGAVFYRRIASVDAGRGVVEVDIPVRHTLRVRDNARLYQIEPHLSEVGLEHLALGMREHPAEDGWGFDDYQREGTGAHDVHASFAVSMNHVVNGWIRNVHTYRPAANEGPHHLVSNGIKLRYTRNVTILDCDFRQAQYRGGGGNGYGYVLQGSDNLIQGCFGGELRYVYDFKSIWSTGNVVHRSEARSLSDFHMHLSAANLLDNLHMNGAPFYAGSRRTWGGIAHGRSTHQSVFWNTRGTGDEPDYVIEITDQPDAVFIIGTRGIRNGIRGREEAHDHLIEGLGRGDTLEPESLYEDQLRRRLEGGE